MLINTIISHGQRYVVEKIQITETIENMNVSEIPKLKDLSDDDNPVVSSINARILDRFMLNSYDQTEIEEFRWYGVECSSEINEDILYIIFSGVYYGAYANGVTDKMFFSLISGEELEFTYIPFQAMFNLSGYLDFLHKYWLEGVQNEFKTAVECAEIEPYCSMFDINYSTTDDNSLSVSLTFDCYPHVAQGCSPFYSITLELDSIKPYLNPIGKLMLLESNYMKLTPIEKFLENKRLKENVPDNIFLFGKIGDRYSISMAINVDNPEDISGVYYYNSKHQPIALKGNITNGTMFLTETVNDKQTGFLEFDINVDNYPIDGKWMNFEKTKSFDVNFTDMISSRY